MTGTGAAETAPQSLSAGIKIRYGVGDFGLSTLTAFIQFYMLMYCTDIVQINAGIAGTAILTGKLTWNMVNDSLCGYISDRTKSRWGRRRPYLLFCAVPLGLAFWLLLSLPRGMSSVTAFFAVLGAFMLFDTFHTMVTMSYYAMNAELTADYNERTSLATVRMLFNVTGYIFGAGITLTLTGTLQQLAGFSPSGAWSVMGLVFGSLAALAVLFTGLTVTQKSVFESEPTKLPPAKAVLLSFKSRPFVSYILIQMIMSIAFTMVTAMLPYFVKYQVLMENQTISIMFAMLGTLALFLVPCKALAEKIGKSKTYAAGLALAGTAVILSFFLPARPSVLIYIVAVVAGIGFSSQWVCPHSMLPDLAEYDEAITGERREGVLYGLNQMCTKVPGAFGSALCGWGLAWSHYDETMSVAGAQPQSALLGIRILFAVIPALSLFACVPLLLKFPVTRESHARLLETLRQKHGAKNT